MADVTPVEPLSTGVFPMFRPVGTFDWHKYEDCPRAQVIAGPHGREEFDRRKLRIQQDGAMIDDREFRKVGQMCPDCFTRWMKAMYPT